MDIFIRIVFVLAALAAGAAVGYYYRRNIAEAKVGRAEETVSQMIDDAQKRAEAAKKEKILESKEEIIKQQTEFEKECKDRRQEMQRTERRVQQREESVDKKVDKITQLQQATIEKEREIDKSLNAVEEIKAQHVTELEKISQLSAEEAKSILLRDVEQSVRQDASLIVKEIESKAKEEGDRKARDIIALAIQRCAADHVAEVTVSVVALPNDEMKGRIIGREGRNIRTFETATGIDLIIDDTPEAVVLSGFDPVRREIAKIALEKLIQDGRIHPARIEELVNKARKEVDNTIRESGEDAVFAMGIHNIHPEMVKLLGRLRYRTSYGQNILKHSIEVAHLCSLMASELNANVASCKRAGLLHDIGKAVDHETEGSHTQIGVDLAKKYKEKPEIIHAIAAHHNDIEPTTVEAIIVQAADAISAARPGARSETIESYIKRLEKLEKIANEHPGVESSYAIQAGREIRIIVKPDEIPDAETALVAREICKSIESELDYPGQIKVNVIRETRSIDFAK